MIEALESDIVALLTRLEAANDTDDAVVAETQSLLNDAARATYRTVCGCRAHR